MTEKKRAVSLEELELYRKLSDEYDTLAIMRDSLYSKVYSPRYDTIRGGKKSSGDASDPTAKAVRMIGDLDDKLVKKRDEIIALHERVNSFIESVDPTLGKIIALHYISGYDWGKVCVKVYGYHSYHTCRKAVMRYYGKER